MKNRINRIGVISLSFLTLFFFVQYKIHEKKMMAAYETIEHKEDIIRTMDDNETKLENQTECSMLDSVVSYMKEIRLKYPDIVLAQAIIESGTWTSNVFNKSYNMFGMKYPKTRPTVAVGRYGNYAKFKSWKDSVLDYMIYQLYMIKPTSRNDYLGYLGSRYAEDPNYVSKVIRESAKYAPLFK